MVWWKKEISSILKNPEDNLNVVAVCARNKVKAQKKLNDFSKIEKNNVQIFGNLVFSGKDRN